MCFTASFQRPGSVQWPLVPCPCPVTEGNQLMMVLVPSRVRLPRPMQSPRSTPSHTRPWVAVPPPLPALSLAITKHVKKYILFRNVWDPLLVWVHSHVPSFPQVSQQPSVECVCRGRGTVSVLAVLSSLSRVRAPSCRRKVPQAFLMCG